MSATAQAPAVRLSVVVVNWNGAGYLGACLDSVRGPGRELIVVDNASRDGSALLVRESHPDVRWLANDENLGFARAANRGLRAACGDSVLFLNPDARAGDEAIAAALAVLDQRPDVGLVGVAQRDASGALTPTVEPFFSLWELRRPWTRRVRAPQGSGPVEIDWCHGAFLLGRRARAARARAASTRPIFSTRRTWICAFACMPRDDPSSICPRCRSCTRGTWPDTSCSPSAARRPSSRAASSFTAATAGAAATLLLRALAAVAFAGRTIAYRLTGSPLAARYAALTGVALRGRLDSGHPRAAPRRRGGRRHG